MKKVFCALLFLVCSFFGYSQISSSEVNKSPYSVIYNHFYYLQDENYDANKAGLSFPAGKVKRSELAIELHKIISGKGIAVNFDKLPTDPNYMDTLAHKAIYYLTSHEKKIYVEKIDNKWYYSHKTIEVIPALHDEVFLFELQKNKYLDTAFWKVKFLKLQLSEWLYLFGLLLVSFLAYLIARILIRLLFFWVIKKKFDFTDDIKLELIKSANILGMFCGFTVFTYLLPVLEFPVIWNSFLLKLSNIVGTVLLTLFINRTIDFFAAYLKKNASQNDNKIDDQLIPAVTRILKSIIWFIAVIHIMSYLGVNLLTALTGLSIGGLALALAAQDTVKNLIGSMLIFIDRPFLVGDWIKFGEVEGIVEKIGARSTRIRTFEDSIIYVPNNKVVDTEINNIGLRKTRRFKTEFPIDIHTKTEIINDFIEKIREILEQHPFIVHDKIKVFLHSMDKNSLNVLMVCYFKINDGQVELQGRHDILSAIVKMAKELDLKFAIPAQTIFIDQTEINNKNRDSNDID